MNVPIEKKISTEFHVDSELQTILRSIPFWSRLSKEQARLQWDAITVDQAIDAAKLSIAFQDMTLREKYVDPLILSPTSSAIIPRETLEHLVAKVDGLDGFEFLTNDPGLFLIRNWKRPFSTVKRRTRHSWILMDGLAEIDEAFICTSRFTFFKKWRWLLPSEFETAKDDMKALASKHNWPIIL